jgi:hypothetical protein
MGAYVLTDLMRTGGRTQLHVCSVTARSSHSVMTLSDFEGWLRHSTSRNSCGKTRLGARFNLNWNDRRYLSADDKQM